MTRRARSRTPVACAVALAIVGCSTIWGIDDGRLAEPSSQPSGAPSTEPSGARGGLDGEGGDKSGWMRIPRARAAGGLGEGGAEGTPIAGAGDLAGGSQGGSASTGGSAGSGGSAGGAPTCSGCKLGESQSESQACGRCGTGSQSHTRTCDANCTYSAWSAWSTCSQCDQKPYRCCGAGKWEWCYDSDCAWTNDCEPCTAASCPGC